MFFLKCLFLNFLLILQILQTPLVFANEALDRVITADTKRTALYNPNPADGEIPAQTAIILSELSRKPSAATATLDQKKQMAQAIMRTATIHSRNRDAAYQEAGATKRDQNHFRCLRIIRSVSNHLIDQLKNTIDWKNDRDLFGGTVESLIKDQCERDLVELSNLCNITDRQFKDWFVEAVSDLHEGLIQDNRWHWREQEEGLAAGALKPAGGGVRTSTSIELPSDPDMMGVNAVVFPEDETRESWDRLYRPGGLTDQTLENFSRGDARGIFLVHSLEDIMGAAGCFTRMWNKNHPEDQRIQVKNTVEEFHTLFSNEEFVSHYAEYVLAQRYLIAGSVVAFNDLPQYTLGETFSPVSFIMRVPPECILVTAVSDANTSVHYAPFSETDGACQREMYGMKAARCGDKLSSLDSLLRFPAFQGSYSDMNGLYTDMNEVAFFSCANIRQKQYRPEIVGVLINEGNQTIQADYGNACRNKHYVDAAKYYAELNGLPTIQVDKPRRRFCKYQVDEIIDGWFEYPGAGSFSYRDRYSNFWLLTDKRKQIYEKLCKRFYKLFSKNIDSNEINASDLDRVFWEDPDYKKVYDITNSLKVKGQKYLMSQEQLTGYGLR